MVLLLEHKPLINVCLCVRDVHLTRMDDVLVRLFGASDDTRCLSVFVLVGSLYDRVALARWYAERYPTRHLMFLDVDETEIRGPTDIALHLALDKYVFVEVDQRIDGFSLDHRVLALYWSIGNLVTPTLSFVGTEKGEARSVALYVNAGRCLGTTTTTRGGEIVGTEIDPISIEGSVMNCWYLKAATGYIGAPNKNREVFAYPVKGPHTRFVEIVPGLFVYDDYLFDKSAFEIVVARYTEPMEWARKYQDVVTVYEKHEGGDAATEPIEDGLVPCSRRERLPNVGREAHTYLHHIITNYDSLARNTLFTQCGIEEHDAYPIEEYMFDTGSSRFFMNNFRTIYAKNGRYGFLQHKWKWLDDYNNGNMLAEKRTFKQWWAECLQKPLPHINRYKWSHGAIFSVSAERICNNSIDYYRRMIESVSSHSNPETGHYFERAWYYVFET